MRLTFNRPSFTLWLSTYLLSSPYTSAFQSPTKTRVAARSLHQFHRSSLHHFSERSLTENSRLHIHCQSTFLSRRFMSSEASSDGSSLRVALCQFPVTPDKSLNHQTAKKYIAQAADAGAQLVVLPEIWNSPYATAAFPEYAEKLPDVENPNHEESPSAALLQQAAHEHNIWLVGGSIPERQQADSIIFNTSLVYDPRGNLIAKHRKAHLFDIDVPGGITFRESDTLSPGPSVTHFSIRDDIHIGLGICYDIRFPEYAMLLSQQYNCSILVYPGAFNMTTGPAHWELLQRARAVDNQCYVLTASPARSSESSSSSSSSKYPHYTAWGHSTAVSPWGDVLATRDETAGIVVADLDLDKIQQVRKSIPIQEQKRTDLYKLVDRA